MTREMGSGLLESLVAIALLGTVATLVVGKSSQVMKTKRHVELEADRTALKAKILASTNCRAIAPCQGNQLRALVDFDNRILVSANGNTTFGPWTVQARCGVDKALEVRVAWLDAKGQALKEPLQGTLLDWQTPEGILIERGILCGPTDQSVGIEQFVTQVGPRCLEAQGTCPHPYFAAPAMMCCEDGSNGVKPACPMNTQEIAAYWDRQDDWGVAGQWVVLCRN